MKKLSCCILLSLGPFFFVGAQHCPWDFYTILVVEIRPAYDSTTIKNLEVSLVDSLGNDVLIEVWNGKQWIQGISRLWENPSETTYFDVNPVNPKEFRFWFAQDNYVLFCNDGIVNDNYKIRIRDVDGTQNQGKFRTIEVEIYKEDFYPLCTHYSKWDSGEKKGFIEGYEPVKIVLIKE